MAKSRKKPSAAQLRARAKFSRIMKAGGFKKSKKKRVSSVTKRRKSIPKRKIRITTTRTITTDSSKSLLLDDIAKLGISTSNKMKIIKCISNRLKI